MYSIEKINIDDKSLNFISIKNKDIELKLLDYGASLVELLVADNKGKRENIILTHENIYDYIENSPYFGATIGRTSGRIANGKFSLNQEEYQLNNNYDMNSGHGGYQGFNKKIWNYKILEGKGETSIIFNYYSKDMEENYPGNLQVYVKYTLRKNKVIIEYYANTDKTTLCNLTNHSYFNLSGNYKKDIKEQYLSIRSDEFLELNENMIPTGKFINVENTPMDFRKSKAIKESLDYDYPQIKLTNGLDHAFLLREFDNAITMVDKQSKRKMEISTTYPCVVIYSYNFPGNEKLKYEKTGKKHDGICFETQYEPDGINHENMNSAILKADEDYYEKTEYKFSII
ncbi:aldose epimerase family protein [Senegalia sp. (in: firmicutes)]|uniref:aldose epimerase family protein n=1 Tax=Senegalia sp. (in: firmicutes) TaxID=1924098 RepID=UPI003F9E5765